MDFNLLLSYQPLAATPRGTDIACTFERHLFEDGSIRTEPNLRHEVPSVSGLCRKSRVVGNAHAGSVLVYVTVRRKYPGSHEPRQFLTAILKVKEVLPSHDHAADWYRSQGLQVPRNCVSADPLPAEQAVFGRYPKEKRAFTLEEAEAEYQKRGVLFGRYLICESVFVELAEPPEVDLELLGISRYSTQKGKLLTESALEAFFAIAGVPRGH